MDRYSFTVGDLRPLLLAGLPALHKRYVHPNTPGVLDRNGRFLNSIAAAAIERLAVDGTVQGGTLPKMDAALHAVQHGVHSVHVVDGQVSNALLLEVLTSEGVGTSILPDDASQFLADSRRYPEALGRDTRCSYATVGRQPK